MDDKTNNNEEKPHYFSDEEVAKYREFVNTCDHYYDEYKDCRSIKARLHQLFVHGEQIDCEAWKRDYDNCKKWRKSEDLEALNEVAKSELGRKAKRLAATRATATVWQFREEPPSEDEWSPPLPNYLQQKVDKNTIAIKESTNMCVTM